MDIIKNGARGTLSAGINSSATSATTTTGHGARFATTAQTVAIWNQTDYGNDLTAALQAGELEYVRATRSGETWTITARGVDGTSATNLNTAGKTYGIAQVPSAGFFAQLSAMFATRVGKTSGFTVAAADKHQFFDCTSGTFTVALTAAATLGDGFSFAIFNSGSGVVTIDPNGTETIRDAAGSATTKALAQGEGAIVVCDGSGFLMMKIVADTTGGGGMSFPVPTSSVSKTASFTITTGDKGVLFDVTTSGAIGHVVATLPSASTAGAGWYCYIYKNPASDNRHVETSPATTVLHAGYQKALIYSDGTNWIATATDLYGAISYGTLRVYDPNDQYGNSYVDLNYDILRSGGDNDAGIKLGWGGSGASPINGNGAGRVGASARRWGEMHTFILELGTSGSLGTPATDSARIGAKDVSGTTEVFVKDEAGNETQISPHAGDAPSWLSDDSDHGADRIIREVQVYTRRIRWTNETRRARLTELMVAAQLSDAVARETLAALTPTARKLVAEETFEEYHTRTGVSLDDVPSDELSAWLAATPAERWQIVQAKQVAERAANIAANAQKISDLESLVSGENDPVKLAAMQKRLDDLRADAEDMPPLTAKPVPLALGGEAPQADEAPALTTAQAAQQLWQEKLAGRLLDTETGIEIEANEGVRNLLTGQLTMISVAISVGAMTPETPQDIWDADGAKHTMPAGALIGLILRHGARWGAMFAEFAP